MSDFNWGAAFREDMEGIIEQIDMPKYYLEIRLRRLSMVLPNIFGQGWQQRDKKFRTTVALLEQAKDNIREMIKDSKK